MKTVLRIVILLMSPIYILAQTTNLIQVKTEKEPLAQGKFQPTWESLY
jgi:alpha-L-fucosidase